MALPLKFQSVSPVILVTSAGIGLPGSFNLLNESTSANMPSDVEKEKDRRPTSII